MDPIDPKRDAISHQVLSRFLADRAAGESHDLAHYQKLFPGYEDLVAAELSELDTVISTPTSSRAGGRRHSTVGPYRLVSELGRGGQGSVYLASDERLGRQVALKLLSGLTSFRPDQLARFQREAELLSRLDHPGIATVYDSGLDEQVPYVAMRYVAGETLHAHIARQRDASERSQADLERAMRWLAGAARIVHFAHESGVLHRDIKPSNLMIAPDGEQVVLLDFGLARDLKSAHSSLTQSGDVFGTPAYMAPEQIEARGPNQDPRTDVYALGAVLYEALTLRQPFEAATQAGLYQAILNRSPEDPRHIDGRISRDLAVVIATSMAKEPQHRYRSALDFARDLDAVLESRSIAARPTPFVTRGIRWLRREPARALLSVALLAAGLVAAGMGGFLLARAPAIELGEAEITRRRVDQHIADAFGHRNIEHSMVTLRQFDPQNPTNTAQILALAYVLCTVVEDTTAGAEEALGLADRLALSETEPDAADRIRIMALEALGDTESAAELRGQLGVPAGALTSFLEALCVIGRPPTPEKARESLPLLDRAVVLSRRPVSWILEQRVLASMLIGEREIAADAADALELHFPDSATAWFFVGVARFANDREASEAAYRRSTELDPTFPQPFAALAATTQYNGDAEEARRLYAHAIRHSRTGSHSWRSMVVTRAKVLVMTEDFGAALQTCTDALALDARSSALWIQKSAVLRAMGQLEEARDAASIALDLEPDNPAALAAVRSL